MPGSSGELQGVILSRSDLEIVRDPELEGLIDLLSEPTQALTANEYMASIAKRQEAVSKHLLRGGGHYVASRAVPGDGKFGGAAATHTGRRRIWQRMDVGGVIHSHHFTFLSRSEMGWTFAGQPR